MSDRFSFAALPTTPISRLAALLWERTRAAFPEPVHRVPRPWLALWIVLYFLGILGWGWATGFLKWQLTALPPGVFVRTSLILILFPGVAEELVFRVWLLPHPGESASRANQLRCLLISTAIFTLWHVVNAWLFFPVARPVFWDWRFLVITAWLGWVCGGTYLRTGTIWVPVAIHWLTVVLWKACCAGPVFFE
jgi:predicted Abi (CAAX) family protease